MIDLHAHSTASDGSLSPTELAEAAVRAGLTTLALTDHDCAKGLPEFLAAAKPLGLRAIPGIELSAEVPSGQLHLVGLAFDYQDPALTARFARLLGGRSERNALILEALNQGGIALTEAEVRAFAGDELVSRVHFAQALIAKGHASDVKDAFARFLAKGAPFYRDRFRYTPAQCLEMIHAAGGVVMMAHPLSLTTDWAELDARIGELKALGLDGMECYYSTYDQETTLNLLRLARRHNLVPSVGSDFHGAPKPDIFLGRLPVPPETEAALLALLARCASR